MLDITIPNMTVLFGPPGCGKTTELSRLVRHYAEQEGPDTLLLCSYTKTGARELAGRDLPLKPEQIGTLHSHCFQGLEQKTVAASTWKKWNEAYPYYLFSPQATHHGYIPDEMPTRGDALAGDACLHQVTVLRNQCIPVTLWHPSLHGFWRLWQAWKADHGVLDFTDLLERALQVLPVAPGHPETIIIDEAQDLSLLMWRVIQSWARHATRVLAAGDDDQALYRWAGGDFTPLLACQSKRVLPQSYRVPHAVQAYAERFTRHIRTREPKQWAPRSGGGRCTEDLVPWNHPALMWQHIRRWLEDPWETVMCIAPCSYMLQPLMAHLKAEGIPFSNRWRRHNRAWNPLAPPATGVSTAQRLADFLRPQDRLWTWQELGTWIPLLHSEQCLRHGAKAQVSQRKDETAVCPMLTLQTLFQDEALQGALSGSLAWFASSLLQEDAKKLAYPLRVVHRYGRLALDAEPQVTIGTCHSLKGAEADRVAFWPTLSHGQQAALRNGGTMADDVWRTLYVGATRAKEELVVCHPAGY